MTTGINAETGRAITDLNHIKQSVKDILTTPIGSRVMKRDYGSFVFELIDQANNTLGKQRLIAATADALLRWEPRIKISEVNVQINANGETQADITAVHQTGEPLRFGVAL